MENLDWKRTLELLDKDVKYYENPIDMPCKNFEEVEKLWKIIPDNQRDITYKFEIVAFNENTCIINWQMQTLEELISIFPAQDFFDLDENIFVYVNC